MSKFIIGPHMRLQEWVAEEKGYYKDEGLDYEFIPSTGFSQMSVKSATELPKDQIKGALHEAKGKLKEKAGQVTNDPALVAEGQDENLGGKIQKKVGQIEKVFGQ